MIKFPDNNHQRICAMNKRLSMLLLLGVFMICSRTVNGQAWELTKGPEGGTVYSLLPIGDYLLAGVFGGIYRYNLNEGVWKPANNGLVTDWRITDFFRIKQTILASSETDGLFASTDSGATWHKTGTEDQNSYPHMRRPTVYDTLLYTDASDNDIYYSDNSGKTWVNIPNNFANSDGIDAPVRIGNYLIVDISEFSSTGVGIYRTTFVNGAWQQTWTKTANLSVESRFFVYPPFVFVGTGNGLYRSADSGKTWVQMTSGLPASAWATNFAAGNGCIYFSSPISPMYRSSDSGKTWSRFGTSLPSYFNSMGFAVAGSKLYCNTQDDGVLVSADLGNTWTNMNNGLNQRPIADIEANGRHLYAATDMGRLFVSDNRGQNWRQINQNLLGNSTVRCLGMKGATVFAGTWGGGIFKSSDSGATWDSVNNFLTERYIVSISVCDTAIYAGTTDNIFQSRDNGNRWISSVSGLKPYNYIKWVTRQGRYLFAGADSIYRSSDNGATWSNSSSGITGADVMACVVMGNYVFAGGNGIFRSADSGNTWTPMNFGLAYKGVNDLKAVNGALLAGTTQGFVFISRDSASFWDPLGTQLLPKYNTLELAVSDSFLYAGGSISSVWRLPYLISSQTIKQVTADGTLPQPLTITTFGSSAHQMRIAYSLSRPDRLAIKISDILGRVRYSMQRQNHPAGNFVLTPETGTLRPGYYVVSLYTGSTRESRMVVIH